MKKGVGSQGLGAGLYLYRLYRELRTIKSASIPIQPPALGS